MDEAALVHPSAVTDERVAQSALMALASLGFERIDVQTLDYQWDKGYPSNVAPKTLKLTILCNCGDLRNGHELLHNAISA